MLKSPQKHRPTLADVARLCGLSKTTVSAVMKPPMGNYPISAESRRRIEQAIAELGYQPSYHGRALANGKTYAVGLIVSSVSVLGGAYEPACQALTEAFQDSGYHMLFITCKTGDGQLDWLLGERRVDAQIIMDFVDQKILEKAMSGNVPTVFCNFEAAPGHSQVLVDERQGMTLLRDHLMSLGHRRIAYVEPQPRPDGQRHYSEHTRRHLYDKFIVEAGLEIDTWTVGRGQDRLAAGVAEMASAILARPQHERPTAVIGYSHLEAIGLMHELWRRGVRVPQEISIVAFNDVYPTAITNPALTVISTVTVEMGRRVAELVMHELENRTDPETARESARTILMPVKLIQRGSSGPAVS